MANCALLFGEFGQLAHNAALGAAAICGNSAIAPSASQGISQFADIELTRSLTMLETGKMFGWRVVPDSDFSDIRGAIAAQDLQFPVADKVLRQKGMQRIGDYLFFNGTSQSGAWPMSDLAAGDSAAAISPQEASTSQNIAGSKNLDALGGLLGSTAQLATTAPKYPDVGVFEINHSDSEQIDDLMDDKPNSEEVTVKGGGLRLTGGYSSIEGVSIGSKISRTNIFGPNTELSAAAHYSKVRSLFELSYTSSNIRGSAIAFAPTLFATRLSATGFGVSRTPFNQSARGINILVNRRFEDGLSISVNYRLSDDRFRLNRKRSVCDIAVFGSPLCGEIGNRTNSVISIALTFDEKNQVAGNLRRYRLRLAQDTSVGGSASFTRTRLSSEMHIGLGGGWSFSLDAEGGFIGPIGKDKIPLFERFYIGDSSMRGFDLRGIGPKIHPTGANPGENIAIGGNAYYVVRTDLSVTAGGVFGRYALQPGVFIDAGSVFAASKNNLLPGETLIGNAAKPRVSVGIGLAINTPAGKLRIDFVKPVLKQSGDKAKMLSISFGAAI